MKVWMVGPVAPHRGGIVHYTEALANALAAKPDVQVRLLAYRRLFPRLLYRGPAADPAPTPGSDVPVERILSYGDPRSWRRAGARLDRDIVHFQVWTGFLGPSMQAVVKRARRKGIPSVATLHNLEPHDRREKALQPLLRRLVRSMDAIVVHGQTSRAACIARFGMPADKVHVVPHARYDHFRTSPVGRLEARTRLGLPDSGKVALMFGTIRAYKGHEVMVRALARLPGWRLLVAGQPWGDAPDLEALATRLGVRDRLHLHSGYVADADVGLFHEAADLAVFPYHRFASQSGAAMTAVEFGLPIVASNVGELATLTSPGGVVAVGDDEGLAQAIDVVSRSRGREDLPGVGWDEAASRYLSLYRSLVPETA